MFTINTRMSVRGAQNELKWEGAEKPQFNASGTDTKLAEVKALLKGIETSWLSHSSEVEKLTTLLREIDTENKKVSKQIDDAIVDALTNPKLSQKERADIQALQTQRKTVRTDLEKNIQNQEQAIKLQTTQERKEFIKDNDNLSRLANLDGDSVVSDTSRDFVSERALKQAISVAAGTDQAKLEAVYNRVVGSTGKPNWESDETYEKFHSALRTQVAVVRELTGGGNAGLEVVLQGKTDKFIEAVQKKVAENGNKPLEVKSLKESTATYNTLGAIGTFVTALATAGLVTFGTEKHNIDADDFIKAYKAQAEGRLGEKAGAVAGYIKDAFMGRRLSLTKGAERLSDYNTKIITFAEQVMKINHDSPDQSNELGKQYALAKKIPGATAENIQKVLIQSYIIGEGYKSEGSNWSASIGLLMLAGAHRDGISVKSEKTGATAFTQAEQEVTKSNIDKSAFNQAGIKIDQEGSGWKYTIPTALKLPGDAYIMPVAKPEGATEVGGNYVLTKTEYNHLKIKRLGTSYTVEFTPGTAPQSTISTIAGTPPETQKTDTAKALREGVDLSTVSGQIFWMSRNKKDFPTFNEALKLISDGKYREAYNALMAETKAKTVAKAIVNTFNLNTYSSDEDLQKLQAVNTYKYGVRVVKEGTNNVNQSTYSIARKGDGKKTHSTVLGEKNLLKGEFNEKNEKEFAQKSSHTARELSKIHQGQQLSVTVAATPLGGTHTKDKYTGSLTVSDQILTDLNDTQKNNLLIDHEKKVKVEFKKFQEFLKEKLPKQSGDKDADISSIKIEDYKNYLKDGSLPQSWKTLGISASKEPKMFEARAMVQGNRCMNYTVGIAYPLFSLNNGTQTITQASDPVVSVEGSTPLNDTNVQTDRLDVGLGTLGVVKKVSESKKPQDTRGQQDSTPGGEKTPVDPNTTPTGPHTNLPSTPVGPTPAPAPATNTPSVNIDALNPNT